MEKETILLGSAQARIVLYLVQQPKQDTRSMAEIERGVRLEQSIVAGALARLRRRGIVTCEIIPERQTVCFPSGESTRQRSVHIRIRKNVRVYRINQVFADGMFRGDYAIKVKGERTR